MSHRDPHACPEYNALSRRGFLASTGATAVALAAAPVWLPRVSLARDHRSGPRDVIVSIYLRGASDGLSLVPPHAENAYYTARPTLAVPRPSSGNPNAAINLDGFFGIARPLQPLYHAYQQGQLLFVHACGSHDPSRSHFEAQRFMEVGVPQDPALTTGWLGRHLASTAPSRSEAVLRAVGISTGLQLTLEGGPSTLPIPDLASFGLAGPAATATARRNVLATLFMDEPDPLSAAAITTLQTIDLLNTISFSSYSPANAAVYPEGSFGTALKSTAALIKADVGVEAVAIDLGGWDTHNSQGTIGGALDALMTTFGQALGAFHADIIADNAAPSTTLVAMSEFGRRLNENGSQGTDHGHGNVMIVMGRCVQGGRVLRIWPGLAQANLFEGRDLAVTIDYRDVLAEIVQRRLGNNDLATVFPNFTPTMRGVLSC